MKIIYISISIAIVLLVANFFYNNFFFRDAIVGSYANTNYSELQSLADMPNFADTLILYPNNHFKSSFWGTGSYIISYTVSGTKIELIYNYRFGKGEIETPIKRMWWSKPRIILSESQERYYEKIE